MPGPDRDLLRRLHAAALPRTSPFACPYLPDRVARYRGFVADRLDGETYHALMDAGFRRAGGAFYAMDCPGCRACVPLRVPVAEFRPSRSQRRTWRRNRDLTVEFAAPRCSDEAFALYRRYLRHRHPDTPADETREHFEQSLYAAVVDSVEARYRLGEALIGVSLLDVCSRSVSAVYHFFEPAHARRRLGVFSVLAEIEYARQLGAPWYYLGYLVAGARTMAYKADYRPHELLRDGVWQRDAEPR